MTAENLAALKVELTRDEGRRRKPYSDTVGKTSIGVGRNLSDVGLSDDEIDLLLANDIARAMGALSHALPWSVRLDPVRERALINLTFNLGLDGLLGFPNFLDALRTGDNARASEHLLDSKYARQVGNRATRLAHMIATGHSAGTRGDGWAI